MEYEQPDWVEYWNNLAPKLEASLESQRVLEVEKYLTAAFSLFSYLTEKLSDKVTAHEDIAHAVYPMVIQIQDMLRTNIHCQRHMLFAPAQFNIRVAFEIRANLLYIYNHKDPRLMLDRLIAYSDYEKLCARKQMSFLKSPSIEEEADFVSKHPYWEDTKSRGNLKLLAKWNGEKKNLYDICAELSSKDEYKNILEDFFSQYLVASTFIHGSPIVKEMYIIPKHGLYPIVAVKRVTKATMIGTHIMMMLLEDFMKFFRVSYREVDFAYVHKFFLEAQKESVAMK